MGVSGGTTRHLSTAAFLLMLTAALSACQTGKYMVADAKNSACYLAYELADDSRLKISSPELNRQFYLHRQLPADQTLQLTHDPEPETVSVPKDLKFTYSNPGRGDKTEVKIYFDEESWQLNRARLDMELLAQTWLLELDARLDRESATDTPYSLAFQADLTQLLWSAGDQLTLRHYKDRRPALLAPEQFSPRQLAQATGTPAGDIISMLEQAGIPATEDGVVDRELWQRVDDALGIRVSPQEKSYHAFHKLTLGRTRDQVQRMHYSLGAFLPARLGELVATYRLLHKNGEEAPPWGWESERGYYEHALALAYTGHFEGPVRSLGNTLTAYKFRDSETGDGGVNAIGDYYEKVENQIRLSWGAETGERFKDIFSEYRIDLSMINQQMLAYSQAYAPERKDLAPDWESQLRLKTGIGTLYGRYRFGESARRTAFGLEKRGQGASLFKLYCKDVAYTREGTDETIIGGGIDVPFNDEFWSFLSLPYWKVPEKDLFLRAPLWAFTSPRQGSHVPSLDGASPALTR